MGNKTEMDALSSITVAEDWKSITSVGVGISERSCQQITFVVWLTAGEDFKDGKFSSSCCYKRQTGQHRKLVYDTFILREFDTLDDEFKESVLVGQVLGKNQLGIGDMGGLLCVWNNL